MNWSFLVLLLVSVLVDCEGRGKRQLFREDIPHDRPLDGSFNQRPQGEGSQPGVEGAIPGHPDHPVRFEAQDAIMGSHLPASGEEQFNPYHHHQPIIHQPTAPSRPPISLPSVYPQQQQYSSESHEVHPPLHPPPPPPPTGPYRISPPYYPINPPSGPSSPFETRLRALWNLNYDNGRQKKNNGAVANMVLSLDNRPNKKGKNKRRNNKRRRKTRTQTQAEKHLRDWMRLNGQSVRVTTNGPSAGATNGPTGAISNGYSYRESLNGATILLNGREYVMNLNGFKNGQQVSNDLSNGVPLKSSTAAAAPLLTSSKGNLEQFQAATESQ